MKKFFSAIGKKNIIIISGVILIGIAIYLNLTLSFESESEDGTYIMENSLPYGFDYDYGYGADGEQDVDTNVDIDVDEDDMALGQATLVDNLKLDANTNTELELEATGGDNYFAVSIVNRQRARDQELELLSVIVDSAETMPDVKDKALQDIAAIAFDIEREANIETLIKAKGFDDCVAIVKGENANIIVKTDGLMPNEVAQIKEIVYEQAGVLPADTKIIEKN